MTTAVGRLLRRENLIWARDQIDANRDLGFDVMRVYLGMGLLVRGGLFVSDPTLVVGYLAATGDWFWPTAIAHYVGAAHLGGGMLLIVGLLTRFAAALQIPALVGAVFFVHFGEGLLTAGQSLEFSALVLALLLLLSVFGAGRLSVDHYLKVDARRPRGPLVPGAVGGGAELNAAPRSPTR